jgi:ABC-type glycerol-3-phosphate transport system substrate-binding protein
VPKGFLYLAATLLLVLAWAACGGGGMNLSSGPTGTPAGSYDLTVTGTYTTSGSGQTGTFSHEAKVKLVVN